MNLPGSIWETLTMEQQQCVLEAYLENEKEERLNAISELSRRRSIISGDSDRAYLGDKTSN